MFLNLYNTGNSRIIGCMSRMSLQQSAGDDVSSKSQPKSRFTIDSILDRSPTAHHVSDDEKCSMQSAAPNNDEVAPATDGEHGLQRHDEKCGQPRMGIDHEDEDSQNIDDGITTDMEGERQSSAQCSSLLLAQTAAAFQRRHQRHIAQLRSFSELFFAQYQRQLRNHFRHHSAQVQPSIVAVPPALPQPSPGRCLSGLDYRLDACLRSPWSGHNQGSESPTSMSACLQPRSAEPTSSTMDWSAVDNQQLPVRQPENTGPRTTVPRTSTVGASSSNEACGQCTAVDHSNNSNSTKWTSFNNIGILLLALAFLVNRN